MGVEEPRETSAHLDREGARSSRFGGPGRLRLALLRGFDPRRNGHRPGHPQAAEEGAEVEKIVLLDYEIKHIQNCRVCGEQGACVNKDDLLSVMDAIFAADVHIWGSPLYWYTVSGLVKVLLDRFSCFLYWHPKAMFEERMA